MVSGVGEGCQGEQYVVIVDAPASKIAPCLVAVLFEGHTCGGQFVAHLVKLITADADGHFWGGIGFVGQVKKVAIWRNARKPERMQKAA